MFDENEKCLEEGFCKDHVPHWYDFNDDGRTDAVCTNKTSGIHSILLGQEDGKFKALDDIDSSELCSVGVNQTWHYQWGDLNGDGTLDLLCDKGQ